MVPGFLLCPAVTRIVTHYNRHFEALLHGLLLARGIEQVAFEYRLNGKWNDLWIVFEGGMNFLHGGKTPVHASGAPGLPEFHDRELAALLDEIERGRLAPTVDPLIDLRFWRHFPAMPNRVFACCDQGAAGSARPATVARISLRRVGCGFISLSSKAL